VSQNEDLPTANVALSAVHYVAGPFQRVLTQAVHKRIYDAFKYFNLESNKDCKCLLSSVYIYYYFSRDS
jgi:hypothetical protein